MRFELDLWDVAGLCGVLLVLIGLAVWHWPAAVVALGCAMCAVYYIRESNFTPPAPQQVDERQQQ